MKEKYWTLFFAIVAFVFGLFFSHTFYALIALVVVLAALVFFAFKKNI